MALRIVADARQKRVAQAELERRLKAVLNRQGTLNIGFPGGNVDQIVYSAGEGALWVAFGKPSQDTVVPRFWNAFGVFRPDRTAQTITVEINIPVDSNTAQVAGFFAEDVDTGTIFLMHSGKVGGGRPGIGKSAFLVWSKAKLVEVADEAGGMRSGIAIGQLDDPDLSGRIWRFVGNVQGFKVAAVAGSLETPEFRDRLEEFDRYSKEFSGKKRGVRGGPFEYVTYHGDIVQTLFDDRKARSVTGEGVFNSTLVDLLVKKDGAVSEIYEVKTGLGRQTLYTAIGQLVTHSAGGNGAIAKFLVVPADEEIPEDFSHAIESLDINVRRFRLQGGAGRRTVELVES